MGTGVFKRLLLIAILITGCSMPKAIAAEMPVSSPADLRQHPTGGKMPVPVTLGLYITDLVGIDETRESFELDGYLIARWHDPRLAAAGGENSRNGNDRVRKFRMEDIWTPPIEAANSISHKINSYSIEADKNGDVTLIERFNSVLSNTYALKKFPFDTQLLQVEYEPFLSAQPEIQFASGTLPGTGFRERGHIDLAAWRVQDVRYVTETVAKDGSLPEGKEALFQITIHRRPGFYIWKIFLPIIIMSLIPMVVFWIDPKEFDWLLKVPMMMLLSMVAFEFAIMRDLPRIGYVTFLDAVMTASFAFFFLVMIEIPAVYLTQKGNLRPRIVKVHAAGRWIYPAAYFAVLLILAIRFLA